jgi:hypothetical protein
MKESILMFLSSWASTVLFSVAGAAVIGLFVLIAASAPKFWKYLETIIEASTSGKVRTRLLDAMNKLEHVSEILINSEKELCKEEIKIALADGKIDNAEVQAIANKLSKKALEILTPEIATFKKYLTGELVSEYISSFVMNKLLQKFGIEEEDLANAKAVETKSSLFPR